MKDNQQELFPICDVSGNTIGKISRGAAHDGTKVLHPVVHLHVFNSKGELYLQKRPEWKSIQPGKWDTACGGHVEYGESFEVALFREVKEELGITDFQPQLINQYIFESAIECEFVNIYITTYNGTIYPSDELDGGRFFAANEIDELIDKSFFTPNFESEYQRFLKHIK